MLCVQLCHSHLFAEAGSSDASTGYYSVAILIILLKWNFSRKRYLGLEESFQVKEFQRSVWDYRLQSVCDKSRFVTMILLILFDLHWCLFNTVSVKVLPLPQDRKEDCFGLSPSGNWASCSRSPFPTSTGEKDKRQRSQAETRTVYWKW